MADEQELNGNESKRLPARLEAIRAGMVAQQALYAEKDEFEALYNEERIKTQTLEIRIEQAREQERIKVAEITQELMAEGKAHEARIRVLSDEILILRGRLETAEMIAREAKDEAIKYRTLAELIEASIKQTLS